MKKIRNFTFLFYAVALLISCSDTGGGSSSSGETSQFIMAAVSDGGSGDIMPTVYVMEGSYLNGTPVSGAAVTVEANTLVPYSFWPGSFIYQPDPLNPLPQEMTYAGDIDLTINTSKVTINESLALPVAPALTAPATDSITHDVSAGLSLAWNAISPEPDYIEVTIEDSSYEDYFDITLNGNATTYTIPGGTMNSSGESVVSVTAFNEKGLTGINIDPVSIFFCASTRDTVTVIPQ